MAGTHVKDALGALRADLREVDQSLEGLESLRQRRARLIAAIEALAAVETDMMAGAVALTNYVRPTFRDTVHRVLAAQAPTGAQPATPSEAAMAVLREVGGPLHIRELIALIQARGWFVEREYESLRGTIAGTLDAKEKNNDGVRKPAKATYQLAPEVVRPGAVVAVGSFTGALARWQGAANHTNE